MVHDIFHRYFPEKNDMRILDVGCGTGLLLTELSSYGQVDGIDVSQKAVDFCIERGIEHVSVSPASPLVYASDVFDVVLALDVLEHIEDDEAALREIARVLKPGGIGIFFVPAFMFLWGITDVLSDHYRRYRIPELSAKARAEGFSIVRTSYFNTLLFLPIALLRLSVRALHLHVGSENQLRNPILDQIFYGIFYFESQLLKYVSFPFGVSALVIVRKPYNTADANEQI